MSSWLSTELENKAKKVFEKQYGYKLSSHDVQIMSNNLVTAMECVFKFSSDKNINDKSRLLQNK